MIPKGGNNIKNNILFGKYKILSRLGAGSFGTVYLSKHLTLECYRAIKLIPKSFDSPSTLLSEAQLLKSLQHPGIPVIYDIEEDTNCYYIIEEYVEGASLEEFLLRQSSISPEYFFEICLQLCDIFQYLHTLIPSPVLYLDLKPEHIIVCGTQIKLIDFNVATFLSNLGNIFNLFGNEDYSAPELFAGHTPNTLCDIYSIGKIMQYISKYVNPPLPPNIPQIFYKAAHADPACRFETVDELISAIIKQQTLFQQPHLRKNIAIVGSHPGCGCTHIAFSIVSALNAMGYSAVYYEKNNTNHLRQMLNLSHGVTERNGLVSYGLFKGYPNYGLGISLPPATESISVYDYGSALPKSAVLESEYSGNTLPAEFIDTDLLLYICSNSCWHWQEAIDKGDTLLKTYGSLKIICNMGQKSTMRFLAKRLHTPVNYFPYLEKPFCSDSSIIHFVRSILPLKRRNHLFFRLKKLFSQNKLLP